MDKTLEITQKFVKELLGKLGIQANISASKDEETIKVLIECEDSGILIGHHGKNLESLQTIVGLVIFKKTGVWSRIVLDVGDYRDRRQKQLEELAEEAITKVRERGEEVTIPYLSPSERRIIHVYLGEQTDIQTESAGEGRNRVLTIRRKV